MDLLSDYCAIVTGAKATSKQLQALTLALTSTKHYCEYQNKPALPNMTNKQKASVI